MALLADLFIGDGLRFSLDINGRLAQAYEGSSIGQKIYKNMDVMTRAC